MIVVSLFDGMSCGQEALTKEGFQVECYYASEIKPDGIKVTQNNFPNTIQLGDVTKVSFKDGVLYTENGTYNVGNVDLFIGGSPCQNFSIAMVKEHRKGLDGEKSGLFREYYRLLQEIKPKHFLLENVGSMSKDNENIISELMGVQPVKINSSLLTAQLRNRLYWTNINEGQIPQPTDKKIYLNDILTDGWSDRSKARCLLESDSRPLTTPIKMFHRYYSTGFTTLIFRSQEHYVDCKKHYDTYFKGMSAKEIDIKIKNEYIDTSIYDGVRYLNQNELETLQTMPIGYTSVLDRNSAAGLLGDGWSADVIAYILSFLK